MPFLPGADHLVRMCSALVREQQHAPGAEIEVLGVEVRLHARGEVVLHGSGWSRA